MSRPHRARGGLARAIFACSTFLVPLVMGFVACSAKRGEPGEPTGSGGKAGAAGGGLPVGSDAGSTGGSVAGRPATGVACRDALRVGRFTLELRNASADTPAVSQVVGRVRDGVDPRELWLEQGSAPAGQGICRVILGPTFNCAPACPIGTICQSGGACGAAPSARSVGDVILTGLATPLTMAPQTNRTYYGPIAQSVAYPPFIVGVPIGLQTRGGDYAPLSLAAIGIEPLEVPGGQSLMLTTVTPNPPLAIRWKAPAAPASTRMVLSFDIAHHGGVAAKLTCDLPDTGVAEVPGSLLDSLIARGTAGYPEITLTRESVDSTTIAPGCVEFGVTASLTLPLKVDGVVSCADDTECPAESPKCFARKCG